MTELLLKFSDENGETRVVSVAGERFSIGRSQENDLQIQNSALSRRHVEIQRFADVFVLLDAGSSNGTQLNGENVEQPVALRRRDKLTLGGAIEIEIEIVGNEAENIQAGDAFIAQNENVSVAQNENISVAQTETETPVWKSVFWIAPLAGVFVLLIAGGLLFALSDRMENETKIEAQNDFPVNARPEIFNGDEDEPTEETPTPARNNNSLTNQNSTVADSSVAPDETPTPSNQTNEFESVEKNAYLFLRRISADSQPVLTGEQLAPVNAKIRKYKNSAALGENLRSARKNAAAFQTLAATQNLKPDFLMFAALAKLNETRGDAAQTANSMVADLGKLAGVLGTELANECLLVVAAYEEGGSHLAMRNKLEVLTKRNTQVNPATVRTIWFLRDNGKLSDAAFDFAVRFLAVGTIAQNPKQFGIDAEPVKEK